MGLIAVLIGVVVSLYFGNPGGTASSDPRARLLGFTVFHNPSISNEPSLKEGDYLWVSTFAYPHGDVARGDMIAFFPPHDDRPFVKRVIGTAGDHLQIEGAVVIVNGERLDEPYVNRERREENRPVYVPPAIDVVVPDGALFVLGDNRNFSQDSRYWGYVSVDAVIGRIAGTF